MAVHPDHPVAYYNFRDNLAADLRAGLVGPTPGAMLDRARACAGVEPGRAAQWVERFYADMGRDVARRHGRR